MADDRKLSRRVLIQRSAAVGLALTGSGLAMGCGDDKKELSCNDTSGMSPADLQTRVQLQYVDKTPQPEKTCANCQLFTAKEGACGTCTVVKGPIHPDGYCISWAEKKA